MTADDKALTIMCVCEGKEKGISKHRREELGKWAGTDYESPHTHHAREVQRPL